MNNSEVNKLRPLSEVVSPDQDVYLVGAAFGRERDQKPGGPNHLILDQVTADSANLTNGGYRVCSTILQSELVDAWYDRGQLPPEAPPLIQVGLSSAAIKVEEILDAARISRAIHTPSNTPERIFAELARPVLEDLFGGRLDRAYAETGKYAALLSGVLNHLARGPRFFLHFVGKVIPHQRIRPAAGALGVEAGTLPDPAEYPDGLKMPYQTILVGRAILEALFPAAIRPSTYVNTQHVADAVPLVGLHSIVACYGFYPHSERIRRTVASTLWNKGVALPPVQIIERPVMGPFNPKDIQRWVWSLKDFEDYQNQAAFN